MKTDNDEGTTLNVNKREWTSKSANDQRLTESVTVELHLRKKVINHSRENCIVSLRKVI